MTTKTTFEEVEANKGRAVRVFSGIPGRLYTSDGDGFYVKIMARDVSQADEDKLNVTFHKVFLTEAGVTSPDEAFEQTMAYAERICSELNVPLIDDTDIVFRKLK